MNESEIKSGEGMLHKDLVPEHGNAVEKVQATFRQRLRDNRKRLGCSYETFEALTGFSAYTYKAFELGKRAPSVTAVESLAGTLNTSISYLFGDTDDPRPESVHILQEEMIERNIDILREQRGLTQGQLAIKSDISRITMSRILRGRKSPDFRTYVRLASALEVPIGRLFGEEIVVQNEGE